MATSRLLDRLPQEQRSLFEKFHRLQEVSVALSAEKDLAALLRLILDAAKDLTTADAGSVFVREDEVQLHPEATGKDEITTTTPSLALKVSVNDSIDFPFKEMRLPFDAKTIAGAVAVSGNLLNLPDAYAIPADAPYRHSDRFDREAGYRTRSMLVVPMKDLEGDIIGVLMLLNKKRRRADGFKDAIAFDELDEELITALGSAAAVSIEKVALHDQIKRMFRGFVGSLIDVLERRNYTTAGHCKRMADYAVGIARAMNEQTDGPFKEVHFSDDQLEELEYAGLLHDIGKLSVPDAVLDKRNKLTDDQLGVIAYRLAYARAQVKDPDRLDAYLDAIRRINVPRGVSEEDRKLLDEIRARPFRDVDGAERPLLTDSEHENLSIRRGNLTAQERKEIERHITETWDILKTIPWPRAWRRLPNIAATHHEKLNGDGYPWKLREADIPLGGRILAIVDIFEALTAQDRPYKPPVPVDKTIQIIRSEIDAGRLDREIFELFLKYKVYRMHLDEQTGKIAVPLDGI